MADNFEAFFKQATRCTPFASQRSLVDLTSDLPKLLQMPSDAGKTVALVCAWLCHGR
jgi:hypothetical protein